MLDNKTVLITGGTGSFGKNFARHILNNYKLKKLIIFSRDEQKQFQMQKEIPDERIRFFIGDVRDIARLERALCGVDIVIHAAALKHIPILEYNPFEAINTNIIGSQNICNTAIDQGVEKVILVSTDKAVHPINLYGSTKLCAEKLFINSNVYGQTKFSCVRYGNVIGSRGSIVETLLREKDNNKVYLTDPRMTRFWITLDQSFNLVLFALSNMQGGEVFVPKVPSMKLVDLFDALVPKAKKKINGIRPGEKLHESLLVGEETRHAVELDKYFVILPEYPEYENVNIEERFSKYFAHGKKIQSEFVYSSDKNKDWLTKEDLFKIIKNHKQLWR